MKRIIIILTTMFMLVLMGAYLAFKLYNMDYYSLDNLKNYEEYNKKIYIKDTINVKYNEIPSEEQLVFKNLTIRNDFENFSILEESQEPTEYIKYVLYNENNEATASIWFATGYSLVESYKEEVIVFNSEDIRYEQMAFEEFFEKKDILDDFDLINYIVNTKNKSNTIFDSIEDMKSNYILHYLFSMGFSYDGITLIEGDLKGYIKEYKIGDNTIVEVDLYSGDGIYGITFFYNEYFKEEYIKELLNTIKIK